MRLLFALTICFAVSHTMLVATVQQPDRLWIGGTVAEMRSEPLERYFGKFPENGPTTTIISSNLWRGYAAQFEVRDRRLFLKDLRIRQNRTVFFVTLEWKKVMKDVFPSKSDRFLSWFTGFVVLESPNAEGPWHQDSPRLLFFKDGKLQADRVFSVTEFSEYSKSIFSALDASNEYKTWRANHGGYSGSATTEVFYFLYFFDPTFPLHLLRNYKDFRPNQALDPTREARGSS